MGEERDSRMAGFKLFVFDREAHFIGPQESGCSTIGRSQKAVWILAHHASPLRTLCLSARNFSSAPSEYTEVTQVLDRIRGVTSPKIAKKVDAIFVFNIEGEGKFHVDLKIGNEVSVGAGEPAGKADVTATLSK